MAQLDEGEDAAGEVQQLTLQLPWAHNMSLLQKVKEISTRRWYMQQTLAQGWSRYVLELRMD